MISFFEPGNQTFGACSWLKPRGISVRSVVIQKFSLWRMIVCFSTVVFEFPICPINVNFASLLKSWSLPLKCLYAGMVSGLYIYIYKSLSCFHSNKFSQLFIPTGQELRATSQSNVTCFNLIESHQTHLLVRRQEVRENSQI